MSTAPNILVCIKFVPDPSLLQGDPSGKPDLGRVPLRIGTFDENAVEAALQLASEHGGRVVALALTPLAVPKDVMLKALAMGVAALYLVRDAGDAAVDPLRTAGVLAAAAATAAAREKIERWDMVLCGEASTDEFNGQVGPRLGVAMGLPTVTYATRLSLRDGMLVAERGLEDRAETVEAELPVLATVGNEINTPRMPTVLQIMGAGRKPIVELALSQLDGLDAGWLGAPPRVTTHDVVSPPSTRKRIVIGGDSPAEIAAELLRRLGADGEVRL